MKTKELNLCEILKDCPKGTKLYCSFLGNVYLKSIYETFGTIYVTYNGREYIFFDNGKYVINSDAEITLFPSKKNRDWSTFESPKQKKERFDPKTLKPFDKVLVRDNNEQNWRCDFFSFIYATKPRIICRCVTDIWKYTIPFNDDTAHLVGTTDEATEYYKWWED